MTLYDVLALVGGLAMFLYGMNIMSTGLMTVAGGRLERSLQKLTSSKLRGIGLGLGVTAVIQSSSAVTVMLVGLVNSGIMTLEQTVSVIMGTNIGTTITAWILSLSGLKGNNIIITLLKPSSFSPVIAIIGILMIMFSKKNRKKNVGNIMIGFAVLMIGMDMMSEALDPLTESEAFTGILTMFTNPFLGVLTGAIFTAVIQSSSASVGILQALSLGGSVKFGAALPIIMGQNIGTCVTALLSSIGVNRNAKRVAIVHVMFNLVGTVIFLSVFYSLNAFLKFSFLNESASVASIALTHTIFNLFCTLIFYPFTGLLERLATLFARSKKGADEKFELLDARLLINPAFAVEHCKTVTNHMALLVKESLFLSLNQIENYDPKKAKIIEENESETDMFEDKLGSYLVQISGNNLTMKDSREVSMLLQNIGDFERIADHALNILRSVQESNDKSIDFSEPARKELKTVTQALREIVELAVKAFTDEDSELAKQIEPLEQVIDGLIFEMKSRHTTRLREGLCTLETGFIFADIANNIERISDHCSNIGVCLIEIENGDFDTHAYLRNIKGSPDSFYKENFERFRKKYELT